MATKTIYGTVSTDGTIISGSGFSVLKQDVGTYLIDFEPGYSQTPAVVGSQTGYGSTNQNPLDGIVFPYVHTGSTTALTGNSSGNKADRQFSFIAMGQ